MPSNPDNSTNPACAAAACALVTRLSSLLTVSVLAACGHVFTSPEPVPVAVPAQPVVVPSPEPRPVEVAVAARPETRNGEATVRTLAYAERIRTMPPPELQQEIARLGDVRSPADQMQLALVLAQLRQLPDLIRAQELLGRVLGSPDTEGLHSLARLLASRYGEQRRLEEQLDKQTQQTRDVQRRLDQTTERLEALKAIERSLVNRQATPPGAVPPVPPASRPRSAP
ncbi:MAG: hypothetical protein JWP47_786 [Polaromonas sp.]|jgi:hypothetical protein|nr:hypothetical protein [Polaromonas sp.]